jgi:hypothetical protein
MKTPSFIVALALGCAGATCAQAATYDLFGDFSKTANPNGVWTYGFASTLGGTFNAFATSANPADGVTGHAGLAGWTVHNPATPGYVPAIAVNTTSATMSDGNVDLPNDVVLLHGFGVNSLQAAEVRWTAPAAGTFHIDATFTVRQVNAQANVAVFYNSATIFSSSLQGDGHGVPYVSDLTLKAGDLLTFAVDRNSVQSGFSGNWTGLNLTITTSDIIVPKVGLWWNPDESGSGYALDYKHGVLVVTVYSYTKTGTAQWYLSSGSVTNNVFTSTLDKYQNGQCISCAYPGRPQQPGNDGTMTITFTSPTTATMMLPGGRSFAIVPQDF